MGPVVVWRSISCWTSCCFYTCTYGCSFWNHSVTRYDAINARNATKSTNVSSNCCCLVASSNASTRIQWLCKSICPAIICRCISCLTSCCFCTCSCGCTYCNGSACYGGIVTYDGIATWYDDAVTYDGITWNGPTTYDGNARSTNDGLTRNDASTTIPTTAWFLSIMNKLKRDMYKSTSYLIFLYIWPYITLYVNRNVKTMVHIIFIYKH